VQLPRSAGSSARMTSERFEVPAATTGHVLAKLTQCVDERRSWESGRPDGVRKREMAMTFRIASRRRSFVCSEDLVHLNAAQVYLLVEQRRIWYRLPLLP